MNAYEIVRTTDDGVSTVQWLMFADDHAAVTYGMSIARGYLMEVWHMGRCIAHADELPLRKTAA